MCFLWLTPAGPELSASAAEGPEWHRENRQVVEMNGGDQEATKNRPGRGDPQPGPAVRGNYASWRRRDFSLCLRLNRGLGFRQVARDVLGGHQDTASGSKRASELGVKGQLATADDGLRGITWLTAEGKAVSEDSRKGGSCGHPPVQVTWKGGGGMRGESAGGLERLKEERIL